MRSKISTFASTDMPTVSTMPAMPGNVRAAPGINDITATIMMTFTNSATFASMPNMRYQSPMKITTSK